MEYKNLSDFIDKTIICLENDHAIIINAFPDIPTCFTLFKTDKNKTDLEIYKEGYGWYLKGIRKYPVHPDDCI